MADLVTKVLDDHELIRTRFSLLERAAAEQRGELFGDLVTLLVQHESVESILVHPTARDHLPDGDRLAQARLDEEQQAEERLAELVDMDPTTEVFLQSIAALREEVEEHAAAEEREVLPQLRDHVEPRLLDELGERYEMLKRAAPIRPHPNAGQDAVSNLFGGPILGMVDRVRAAMTEAVGGEGSGRAPAGAGGHAYEDRTVEQLRERAAEAGIEGRSSMDKAQLIAALRRHNG